MKKILTEVLGGQPVKFVDFEFIQEQIRELIASAFGNLDPLKITILSGFDYTLSTDGYTFEVIKEGFAYYNNEYYYIPTQAITGSSPNVLKWVVSTSYDSRGLKTFKDTAVGDKDVYEVKQLTLAYLPSSADEILFSETKRATPVLKEDNIELISTQSSTLTADFSENDTVVFDNVTTDLLINVTGLQNGQIGHIVVQKDLGNVISFDSPVFDMSLGENYISSSLNNVIYKVFRKNNVHYAICQTKSLLEASVNEIVEGVANKFITPAKLRSIPWIQIGVDESDVFINTAINTSTSKMYYRINFLGDLEIWLDRINFSTSSNSSIMLNFHNTFDFFDATIGAGSIWKNTLGVEKIAILSIQQIQSRVNFSYDDYTGYTTSDYLSFPIFTIDKSKFTVL